MSIEFFLTSLIVVLLPGTGVIYTVSTGLTQGSKSSIFAVAGCTIGIIPHLCASIFGVAAILHTSAVAFQFFKFFGVLYLVYLAWVTWRESGSIEFEPTDKNIGHLKVSLRGFFINILNPKLSIFFLAFLPQFVVQNSISPLIQMVGLSVVFMLMTFVVFIGYGVLANQVRHLVISSPKVLQNIQKVFAGAFLGLGLKLAFTDR